MSISTNTATKKRLSLKARVKKEINFNTSYIISKKINNHNVWNSRAEINLEFIGAVNTHLKQHDFSYDFNKHLPDSNVNLSSKKIFKKISLGYIEDAFALRRFKDTVEKVQPSFSTKGENGSLDFKIDTLQSQAKAIYKSSFEAKLTLDFNIQDSEFVLSKNLSKNTAISLNLENSNFDQRQTVNLALAW